jgi:hypothetical protein
MNTTEDDFDKYIGEALGDTCPRCISIVWTDKTGTKWCESTNCNWSNNPEFEKELKEFWNKLQ